MDKLQKIEDFTYSFEKEMEVLREEINRKEEDQADLWQKKDENDYMLNEEN